MLLVPTDKNKSHKEDAELTFGKPTIGRAGFQGSSFAHVSDLNVREFRSLPLNIVAWNSATNSNKKMAANPAGPPIQPSFVRPTLTRLEQKESVLEINAR